MSNNIRALIGVLGVALAAALATPELAALLPIGATQILAAVLAAALHQMLPKDPTPPAAQ